MMTGFERYAKQTKRALFLEELEQVVPWGDLCALIEPYYPKAGHGRPPVGEERMLRIYFLQQWFTGGLAALAALPRTEQERQSIVCRLRPAVMPRIISITASPSSASAHY